ncbi:hypothetical protein EUZ85_15825 [Hahella sp. KA22]|uniref:hypothetical protein n=1 Tax=Hahella sp. KA22 TaxID=1628392 RepID=UPI000FDD57E5|nr:hypothetical protein [Hahella sp. KA22]AZZ92115.1 hypothetical protein ENC22_13260 [Hahella sp. KA22]QAY55486.1 hypothetical protein EUZ85_15825 [Hahella sp. KA22]
MDIKDANLNYTTTNGSFSITQGHGTAQQAVSSFHKYYLSSFSSSSLSRDIEGGASGWDKLGATASVVGAIAGVAGLGLGDKGSEDLVIFDVRNLSAMPLVTYDVNTFGGGVYIDKIPSPLGSGESSTWEISSNEEFEPNEDSAAISFLIGDANRHIDVTLYYAIGGGNRWYIQKAIIDGVASALIPTGDYGEDNMTCLCFTSGDYETPSFSIFTYSVFYASASSYIVFAPY